MNLTDALKRREEAKSKSGLFNVNVNMDMETLISSLEQVFSKVMEEHSQRHQKVDGVTPSVS